MPQASSLYQSPLLSQIAVDFKNRAYIADEVLTPVGVPKMLGQYLVWNSGVTFKIPKTEMAQYGQANMIELAATKTPFTLATHALQAVIDPLERDQAPEAQIEAMKVAKLQNGLMLQREIAVATALTTAATYGSNTDDLSGTDQWSDPDSLPINAIFAAADMLPTRPNTLILGRDSFSTLRVNPQILDALRGVSAPGTATAAQIAQLLELDRVLVGDAFKDTAGENLAADKELIWQEQGATGGMAILAYVDRSLPSPLMDQPTLGYLPTLGGGGAPTTRVYRSTDPNYGTGSGVTRIKAETAYGVLFSAPSMGFLWTSVVS